MNGSAACPPTTQPGSFPISPPPVQLANKASKNSEPSNSHLTSTQHNPAEVVEKPIQKNKEKVSPENTSQYGQVLPVSTVPLKTAVKLVKGGCVAGSHTYCQRAARWFNTDSLFICGPASRFVEGDREGELVVILGDDKANVIKSLELYSH